jgi:hypothetical protein
MSVYKIYCKNQDITDCYIGSTKDFNRRISEHRYTFKNKNNKLYNFIREHGGIDNWGFVCIEDNIEYNLLDREKYWITQLKPTLNIQCVNIQCVNIQSVEYNCEFCNNKYKNISSLNYHKKTTKKCLILRDAIDTATFFECNTCEFKTTVKVSFNLHKCKLKDISEYKNSLYNLESEFKLLSEKNIKLESEFKLLIEKNKQLEYDFKLIDDKNRYLIDNNIELKDKLEKHENQLFTLACKPNIKIRNLNNVLTSLDIKENSIKEKVDNNFTLEYLSEGIKGVAKFTKEHIINPSDDGKQKYICSDPSRSMFKYKDENGVIQKDVRATKLKNAIQEPIINKTNTLISHETTRVREEGEEKFDITNTKLIDNLMQVKNLDDNGNDYAREMSLVC